MFSLHRIWKSSRPGAWLSIYFTKAFDSTSHALLQFFVQFIGGSRCVDLSSHTISERGGIVIDRQPVGGSKAPPGPGQGDKLSRTFFSLLPAVLISKVRQRLPHVESFLFADDSLFFILGTPAQVKATLQTLPGLVRQCADVLLSA